MNRPLSRSSHRSALTSIVISCFFLSGVAGLIYQILWLRMIDKVIGSAPFAVSTVLSVFMGGLALGSYLAGKYIDRISSRRNLLSLYGKVEVSIGIYGLLLPFLIFLAKPVYTLAYNLIFKHFWLYQLFSFFGCSILLLIPTTLMGVTLPVLCRFYVADLDHLGARTGRLYGINTFGAFVGALSCGFLLIAKLGVYGSLFTAIGINILVGALCIGLAKKYYGSIDFEERLDKGEDDRKSKGHIVHGVNSPEYDMVVPWALCIFCVSGFCAMAYEVFWTRLSGLVIGPTIYSFTLVASTFIVGLALGSMLFGWLADRSRGIFRLLVITQVFAACLALLISQFLGNSQFFFSKLIYMFQGDFREMVLVKFVVLFFILIGPTIFLGATFPLVNKIYTRSLPVVGKSIGNAYAVNTIGAILGSFMAGYILIPFLGKENGLRVVVGLQFVVALLALTSYVFKKGKRVRPLATIITGLILGAVLLMNFPSWDRKALSAGWYHRFDELEPSLKSTSWLEAAWKGSSKLAQHKHGESDLVFYGDGIGGFTTVEREVDSIGTIHYSLLNSGKADASTHLGDRSTQTLLAHIPLLFHPNPEKVMVLGLASGMTAGEVLLYPVKRMDVLEINDQVLKACEFFTQWNNHCLTAPNTNIIIQDGRNHLELTREKYDVIISEPSNPWMAGLANLFTFDFFETVKGRLSENGTFVQWIHSYEMDWSTFAMVGRTFAEVFPDGLLIKTSLSDLLLVGFNGQKNMGLETAYNNIRYAKQSTNITIRDPGPLFRLIVTEDLKKFFGPGPLHTDNRPHLEFAAPRNLDNFDAYIAERITNQGWLSSQTVEVVESTKNIDSMLDMLEFSLAQSSPSFDIVDINGLTPTQEKRYQKILMDYCSSVLINNYEIFPTPGLKAQCARLQSIKIKEHMATGREDALGHYNLAVAYRIMGETQEEIDALRKAILLDPFLYDAYNDLGIALCEQGKYEEAVIQFSKVLKIKPGYTEVLNNLGNIFAVQGKTAEAIDYYSRALQIEPDNLSANYNLGLVLADQKQFKEAVDHLLKVLEITPNDPAVHNELGVALGRSGRIEEALHHFSEALKYNPDDAEVHNNMGLALMQMGLLNEAAVHFSKALEINSSFDIARNNLQIVQKEIEKGPTIP